MEPGGTMDFPYKKTPIAAAIAVAFTSAPIVAQETEEVVEQPEIEEIVVTGSRIRRSDSDGAKPDVGCIRGANSGDGNGHP